MKWGRQLPYKFGVLRIFNDVENKHSADYHSDPLTSLGFEFLKYLHDLHVCTDKEVHDYLNEKVNNYVTASSQDFAPLLTEIDIFMSLRRFAKTEIGDKDGRADVRVFSQKKEWDIECKSLRFGYLKDRELRGFCQILNSLSQRRAVLEAGNSFTAWSIRDPVLLANANLVREATQDVLNWYRARKEGRYQLGNNELVTLLAERAGGGNNLRRFLKIIGFSGSLQESQETLAYSVFADEKLNDTRWATAFFSHLKISDLVENCQELFNEAMDQHDKRVTEGKIVLINVECLHILEEPTSIALPNVVLRNALRQRSILYGKIIASGIAQKSRWSTCTGLIIVFALPPFLLPSGGDELGTKLCLVFSNRQQRSARVSSDAQLDAKLQYLC